MTSVALLGVGAYAPADRIAADAFADAVDNFQAGGIQEKAVPGPDEDVVTMAYEAGRRALAAAEVDGANVGRLTLATTNPPLEEEDLLPHLGAMFDVDDDASGAHYGNSTVAGVRALRDELREATDDRPSLVIASDAPRGELNGPVEHAAGAGAAAFVIGGGEPHCTVEAAESSEPGSGVRFRRRGNEETEGLGIKAFDRRTFRSAVLGAVDKLSVDPDAVDAAAVQAPDGVLPYRVAGGLSVENDDVRRGTTVHEHGDTAAASVPLGIVSALEGGAERVLAVGYGSGAAAVGLDIGVNEDVHVRSAIDGDPSLDHSAYVRRRGFLASGPPSGGGGYVSLPSFHRSVAQRYRLEAGRCQSCERLNFPPAGACTHCHERVTYESVALSREGVLETVSVISTGGAPPEFAELQERSGPYTTGIVAFEGPDGGSASVPSFVVEARGESVKVGDRVEMTIRRLYTQDGVPRYGFKVCPIA
jgi:hydroxymethylglutaryl-CoA synthase